MVVVPMIGGWRQEWKTATCCAENGLSVKGEAELSSETVQTAKLSG
jgi:hypothetical protein